MASEIKVDTVSEKTSANGVTIDGVNIKDSKIATANSIDSDAYVDGSIDNAHIADDAIDSEHYADGSIDNAHIADDAIDSEHYAAGSIDTAHIADDQITLAKMAGGTDGNIISYDASGDPVAIATGTAGHFLKSQGAGVQPVFAAAGGGKIGQVVQTVHTGTETLSSTTATTIANFTATITPAATSSKILVMAYMMLGPPHSNSMSVQLFRDTTQIFMGDAAGDRIRVSYHDFRVFANSGARAIGVGTPMYLDSPSTTSAVAYSFKWRSEGSAAIYLNRDNQDSDLDYVLRGASSITAIEVLA